MVVALLPPLTHSSLPAARVRTYHVHLQAHATALRRGEFKEAIRDAIVLWEDEHRSHLSPHPDPQSHVQSFPLAQCKLTYLNPKPNPNRPDRSQHPSYALGTMLLPSCVRYT